jgi:hypothetical protein
LNHRGHRGHRDGLRRFQTTNTLFEQADVEVDKKAKWKPGELQIGQKLCTVERHQLVDRLDLDDQHIVDDQIETISTVQPCTSIDNGEFALTLNPMSLEYKLMG